MECIKTGIAGLHIFEPDVFGDSRGYFMECWHAERYRELGLPEQFVQSNVSKSGRGVLRGLHYQYPKPQGKLVQVLEGRVFDVAVDIRIGSPSFGEWMGVELSAENHRQLYVPEGFAHGFCVLGDGALISYLCTRPFRPEFDAAVAWDDPDIGVQWPVEQASLSAKDLNAPKLCDIPEESLPKYESPSA